MEPNTVLAIVGFAVSTGTTVFLVGRFVGSLRKDIESNERVRQAERQSDLLQLRHMEEKQAELHAAMVEKRDELRRTIEQQMAALTGEITLLRADRHNTTGTVMRHEGALGDLRKDFVTLDNRIARIEDIQRMRRNDHDYPPSNPS